MTGDGIINYNTDPIEDKKTMDLTNAMLDGLGSYDGITLGSMGQERFWDIENMMWYGPSGIGTTRGLEGFQKNHQIPFITSFPDRGITVKKEEDYFTQIAEGNYSCDFGFPAMYGSHKGDGWLGLEATGKKITLRVVDYWRREGDKFKENWVFIDMPDVLKQLGIDVFELVNKEQRNK
jgi:predicted ester cyclase